MTNQHFLPRDEVLNMWADPERISTIKIAAHFGVTNGTICKIIARARARGDERAARREFKYITARNAKEQARVANF